MIKVCTFTAALALSIAFAAAPALAKNRGHEPASRAGFDARAEAIAPDLADRAGRRADAIRECNEQSAKFTEYAWGNSEFDLYRACMAGKGQVE